MKKNNKYNILLIIFVIFLIAYALNFIWENFHYPLYKCKDPLRECVTISAFRDSLIILGIYFSGMFLFKNSNWFYKLDKKKITLLILSSFVIAYIIELQGIYLGKWEYSNLMPIIPIINIGLSPILQMIALPLLTFYITKLIIEKRKIINEKNLQM